MNHEVSNERRVPADPSRPGSGPSLTDWLEALPFGALVLDANRRVVAANRAVESLIARPREEMLGCLLGEIVCCENAVAEHSRCGQMPQCQHCGALRAIRDAAQSGGPAAAEWDLVVAAQHTPLAVDLRVRASSLSLNGQMHTLCLLEDITRAKRLADLSSVFYHDALNLLGGVQGALEPINHTELPAAVRSDLAHLQRMVDQLADEIQGQRDLIHAEAGELQVQPQAVRTAVVLDDLRRQHEHLIQAHARQVRLQDEFAGVIVTDYRLLLRVLGNMLRNALEATAPSGLVEVQCRLADGRVVFGVHNAGVIDAAIQRQIFIRPVSSKRRSRRGYGTLSIKLLGERYLLGRVGFESRADLGTRFEVSLPKVLVPNDADTSTFS